MRPEQLESLTLMRTILGDQLMELSVERFLLEEIAQENRSSVEAHIGPTPAAQNPEAVKRYVIKGTGVGAIDAFFHGALDHFSEQFPSLKGIAFVGFSVAGKMDPHSSKDTSLADAEGEVKLLVTNPEGKEFEFVDSSRSVTLASLRATWAAIEYFINSEQAFLMTRRALEDAKARSRADLIETFAVRLADLVKNTSYTESLKSDR